MWHIHASQVAEDYVVPTTSPLKGLILRRRLHEASIKELQMFLTPPSILYFTTEFPYNPLPAQKGLKQHICEENDGNDSHHCSAV